MSKMQKNLLLITFDQWRGDWGNPYKPIVELPNIRKLAERGITATRCYTSSPHCVPARFSWLTGLEPSRMGVTENKSIRMPPNAPSFVRDLQKAGWQTHLVGKTHWTPHDKDYDLRDNMELMKEIGFDDVIEIGGPRAMRRIKCALTDEWDKAGVLNTHREDLEKRYGQGFGQDAWQVRETVLPVDLYPDIWITRQAINKICTMKTDKPWFLWVSFCGPHEPFDTPRPWKNRNRWTRLPTPIQTPEWVAKQPKESVLFQTTKRWRSKLNKRAINACRRDYADKLQLLDEQVGKLVEALDFSGHKEGTAVAITADHGEHLGDFNSLYKGTFLESAIRVPFVYCDTCSEKDGESKKIVIKKPINVSNAIQVIASSLTSRAKIADIVEQLEKTSYVIVEFKDEIMIIKKNKKVAMKNDGRLLWGTNIKKDPREQENCILGARNKKTWEVLISILRKEINNRSRDDWKLIL